MTMAPPLPYLRVLGTPALCGPDGETIPFRTRKHFALLIYLALEPQLHRREKLAALLWPRATTSEARHSLSTGLSVLRAKLGREAIETTRDAARLIPGSVEIDLDRLARGEIHATDTMAALDIAPLLHDFPVSDAVPWEQWRDGLAAKWQPAIREALLARIDRMRRQGNTRTMEVLADALLSLDDLSEDGVRAKMESRAFAGDRLTALQIYEDWRVRLADELGAQPSDLVAGMATRLRRRGWERTSEEHIPAVRTDQWKDRPFVGRAKEYEVLYEGWEGCERGTGTHVLITGESGVGKSTLMERLTTAAGLQGASAVRVQCHAVEREIPYGAIGSLIGMLLDQPGATGVAPEWLSELGRMVSAVRRRFPNVSPPPEATGETVRIRLADAFHELVRAVADEQPLILVMDDIHLGDDASVAVMHLLLRRLTDERVLVLCTLRQGEEALAPSARGMMERAELARMVVLPLPPLDEAESSELLGQLIPDGIQPPPGTVRRALLRAGSGLPMLMELLVRDWMGHGDRCVALAVGAMTVDPESAGGAGETYRRLLERLTVGLDPNTRSVLNLAAILGSQLNEFELYSLVDLTLAQSMAGLSQLASARIMRDSGHGLEFVNEVMRGEVYLAVPSSVRKVLHSQVADRLIQRSKDGEEMLGLAIAWHCVRSGRVQEAGEWLSVGGREAIERSALAEAEAALESGSHHLPDPHKTEATALLVDVLIDQGRYHEAGALGRLLPVGDSAGEWPAVAESRHLSGLAAATSAALPTRGNLQALLQVMKDSPRGAARLRAAVLSVAEASNMTAPEALELVSQAVASAMEAATGRERERFALIQAQVYFWQRRMDCAAETIHRQLIEVTDEGPSLHRLNLYTGLSICNVARGDYAGALAPMTQAHALAVRAGAIGQELLAAANLSILYYRLGDYDKALHYSVRSQRSAQPICASPVAATALGVEACCRALHGPREAFQQVALRLRAAWRAAPGRRASAQAGLWLSDAFWLAGDADAAVTEAREALSTSAPVLAHTAGLVSRWTSHLLHRNHRPEEDSRLHQAVELIDRVDALDQVEVGAIALSTLRLLPEKATHISKVIGASLGRLPIETVRVTKRLLPEAAQHLLSEHSHPSA
jgi:DNA-binding SARP family transcriptional activator/tetratricopeptide (TPR) repeat protein